MHKLIIDLEMNGRKKAFGGIRRLFSMLKEMNESKESHLLKKYKSC